MRLSSLLLLTASRKVLHWFYNLSFGKRLQSVSIIIQQEDNSRSWRKLDNFHMQATAQPDEAQEQRTLFIKKKNKSPTAELNGKICKGILCAGRNHVKVKHL